jgi:DNA-directed RNA polymerase specialized sigma24 family protein
MTEMRRLQSRASGILWMHMETEISSEGTHLFPRTQWTLVNRLRHEGSPAAERAMEEICRAYWRPLYVYARRFGLNETEAKDAVQDLFLRLLDGNRMATADAERGRLRTFLLASLKNIIATNRERQSAAKRGGGAAIFSLDMTDAEGCYMQEAESHTLPPDEAFDRKWALELLARARTRLRVSYVEDGREQIFDVLTPALLDDQGWGGNASAATVLGMTEGAVKVAVHRLRSRFREMLLKEIEDTVDDEREIRTEVSHLLALFGHQQS